MLPTVSFLDLLAVFAAGVTVGMIAAAFITYKVRKFLNRKFA